MTLGVGTNADGLSQAVLQLMQAVQGQSKELRGELEQKVGATDEQGNKVQLEQQDLLELQFEIGQYNALIETASSVGKGVTDMLKTLAQRTS
jgi:type III secretion protein F